MSHRPTQALAALALLLVACPGPEESPDPSPTSATASPSPSPTPAPSPSLPSTPDPATVPPDRVEGLELTTVEMPEASATATYPVFPDAEPFNLLLADVVRSDLDAHAAAATGSLAMSSRVLVATGDVLGVQLDRAASGDGRAVSSTTFYYDATARRAADAGALLADDDGPAGLARLVAAILDDAGFVLQDDATTRAALSPGGSAYQALAFTHDGDLLVQIPEGAVSGLPERPVRVLIAWSDAEEVTSDLGQRVRDAIVTPPDEIVTPPSDGSGES